MRILMWVSMGFSMACLLGTYGLCPAWLLPACVGCLAAAGLLLVKRRDCPVTGRVVLILLGTTVGILWFLGYQERYLEPISHLDGCEETVSFTVSDYGTDTEYGVSADAAVRIGRNNYPVRVYLEQGTVLQPGDRVTGVFRYRLTVAGEREGSGYYPGKGIFLLLYQAGEITVEAEPEPGIRYLPAVLRREIKGLLAELFPEDTASFAQALLLGDSSGLAYETDTALRISGIRHIIAVSGLHISVLYSLIAAVTFRKRFLTAFAAMPVLVLFAAVAGFTPSVTRACIMVWLMLLARLFDREYDPATALSFAVLVMLMANPLAAGSASLQMSVTCVAGILLFEPPVSRWLKERCPVKKGRKAKAWCVLTSSVSVSLSAVILVTPLCTAYFGTVSLVSVVTNVLTLWAVNLVFK